MAIYLIGNGPMQTTAAFAPVTTGTAIKTLLQVKPSATVVAKIIEWGISFDGFAAAYRAEDRAAHADERWTRFTRETIAQRGDTLDLGLIADDSLNGSGEELEPKALAAEAIDELEVVVDELKELMRLLEINEK